MASDFAEYLRTSNAGRQVADALMSPLTDLLGIASAAGDALQALGLSSIFDLGSSSVFALARAVAAAGKANEIATRHGVAPGDWLHPGVEVAALDGMGALPLESLRPIDAAQAAALKSALDVATVEEFANWPPYRAARTMLGEANGATLSPDELQTEALRPSFGDYPTERVYYATTVMLDMGLDDANLVDLAGPLSLSKAAAPAEAARKPAVGAIVTLSQSWYAQGVTLGQMLHSLALAPGEATRIAVIDWARRTSARVSESVSETEALASETGHQRALSEVQNAVASDMQSGGSTSHVESSSDSGGVGLGLSAIVPVGGALLGGVFGGSYQGASTTTDANSTSWSLGRRSVNSSMAQTVNDRTEQHSSSVRNRRATSVREVSQSEHEQISTRIVANYNHMHALTIQYYEVVQVYRVVAEVQSAERVLFIPIELVDFNDDALIETYRGVLAAGALTARARSLLLDPTSTVEIRPARSFRSALLDAELAPFLADTRVRASAPAGAPAATGADATAAAGAPAVMTRMATAPLDSAAVTNFLARDDAVARGSAIVMSPILRPQSSSLFYPDEVELVGVQLEGVALASVALSLQAAASAAVVLNAGPPLLELDTPIALGDLLDLSVKTQSEGPAHGVVRLHLSYRGRRFTTAAFPLSLPAGPAGASKSVLSFHGDIADRRRELKAHLLANRAHYSAQVFRSLGSAAIVGLLSGFKWQGRPLVDQVEPKILSVIGDYIVLRAPVDADEPSGVADAQGASQSWGALLEDRRLSPHSVRDSRQVPIATDGVFAEAVLGRSNSAEKLDITRFWNWQDSPAPLTPPDLAPIASGSRATAEDLTPGQLGPSTLNIVNPTNLPDPVGLGASLSALAGLNFRDMSGLGGTQGLAGTATQGTLTAATEAGRIAGNFAQSAADVVKTGIAYGYGQKKDGGVSGEGARINQGRDMDARGVSGAGGAGQASGGAASGVSGAGGGGLGGGSGGGDSGGSGAPSHEETAFNQSVGNALGAVSDAFSSIIGKTNPPPPATAKLTPLQALDEADALIERFRNQVFTPDQQKWHPSLTRDSVATRLKDLVHNPDKVQQGGYSLCGEAAFFHVWLSLDPLAVARFGVQLFNAGAAAVGAEEWVVPRESLRRQDFLKVVQMLQDERDDITEAAKWSADWMMMSALRDANNWIFSYEGTPSEGWGAGATNGEMVRWLEATNLFRSVSEQAGGDEKHNFTHAASLAPDKNTIVLIASDSAMLDGDPTSNADDNHWFELKSPVREIGGGAVNFKLWSWGYDIQEVTKLRTVWSKPPLQKTQFVDAYFGAIVAKR